jgi:NAD(P)-dependent dehydrogenase (short-subunit alcohol dehydrogenase family)
MADRITFDDRCVVVTGAGQGLGREFALEFGRRGGGVVVSDIGVHAESGRPTAELVAEEIVAAGGRAVPFVGSVADDGAAEELIAAALDGFGRIDALVNNAALIRQVWLEDLDLELLDTMLAVNLRGSLLVTRAAYRRMRAAGYGRIVTLGSGAGVFGSLGQFAYGASKAGLIGMNNVLAMEGAEYGVLANIVLPAAATARGRTKVAWEPGVRELLGPRLRPETITPLAAYLASDRCTSTGGMYSAVGGRYARVSIGVSEGWISVEANADAEDVAEHWTQIDAHSVYAVPASHEGEFTVVAGQLRAAASTTEERA